MSVEHYNHAHWEGVYYSDQCPQPVEGSLPWEHDTIALKTHRGEYIECEIQHLGENTEWLASSYWMTLSTEI